MHECQTGLWVNVPIEDCPLCSPRSCPRCGRGTSLYAYCDKCLEELTAKGISLDSLWEIEENAYIMYGLAQLSHRS